MCQTSKLRPFAGAVLRRNARLLCATFLLGHVLLPVIHASQVRAGEIAATLRGGEPSLASASASGSLHAGRSAAERGHHETSCAVCKALRRASALGRAGASYLAEPIARDGSPLPERPTYRCRLAALGPPDSRAPPARV